MLRLPALLLSMVFIYAANAQKEPESIPLCVRTLENNTQHTVTPAWQRDQLIKAFAPIGKSKDGGIKQSLGPPAGARNERRGLQIARIQGCARNKNPFRAWY